MTLHEFLDCNYGADGDDVLRRVWSDRLEAFSFCTGGTNGCER